MTDWEKELLRALKPHLAFLGDLGTRIEKGELKVSGGGGVDEGASLSAGLAEQVRALRSLETALENRTVSDPGDFMIDDVMRQAAAIRRSGDVPARVRMSPLDWGKMSRSPNALHMLTVGPPPTVSGIEIVFDGEWDGPVTVEGRSNKPLRPTGDPSR